MNKDDRIEELEDKLRERRGNVSDLITGLILAIILTPLITIGIFVAAGAFDSSITELGLDKEVIIKNHVIEYYPEYFNCQIEYFPCRFTKCVDGREGVEIYCNYYDSRDGLKMVNEDIEPTAQMNFEGITVNDMFKRQLEKCMEVN